MIQSQCLYMLVVRYAEIKHLLKESSKNCWLQFFEFGLVADLRLCEIKCCPNSYSNITCNLLHGGVKAKLTPPPHKFLPITVYKCDKSGVLRSIWFTVHSRMGNETLEYTVHGWFESPDHLSNDTWETVVDHWARQTRFVVSHKPLSWFTCRRVVIIPY